MNKAVPPRYARRLFLKELIFTHKFWTASVAIFYSIIVLGRGFAQAKKIKNRGTP